MMLEPPLMSLPCHTILLLMLTIATRYFADIFAAASSLPFRCVVAAYYAISYDVAAASSDTACHVLRFDDAYA